MNFLEISPGVFVGIHMVTHFEINESSDKWNKEQHLVLSVFVIGSGAVPAAEIVVTSREEALKLLGLGMQSNLNLVKP